MEERDYVYDAIRSQIEDCDIFLFRGKYLSSRLFEKATRGRYSHSGMAAWWGSRLMLLQAEFVGIQAVPLSVAAGAYDGPVAWYKLRPEVRQSLNKEAVLAEARSFLGLPFGYRDLIREFLHRGFGRPLPPDPNKPCGMFCSEFVEHCFREAGCPLVQHREDMDTFPNEIGKSDKVLFMGRISHNLQDLADRRKDLINPNKIGQGA